MPSLSEILAKYGIRPDVAPTDKAQSLVNSLARFNSPPPTALELANLAPHAPFGSTGNSAPEVRNPLDDVPGRDAVNAVMTLANFIGPKGPSINAYHGSQRDFDKFTTPAFFADNKHVAQLYRREGGGDDNLNGLGANRTPDGWYQAHGALDSSGQDRTKAIALLEQEIAGLSPETLAPHYQHHMQRGLIDKLLGLRGKLDPEFQRWAQGYAADKQAAIDFLHSGSPLGKVYEVKLPAPTAHYYGDQARDIRNATAKGHKVITWGGERGPSAGDEIIALDPNVIEILRKYGLIGSAAAPATLSNVLAEDGQQ